MERRGSPQVPRLCADPRGKFHRYSGYASGRPDFFDTPCIPVSALAAVEAASCSRDEAGGSDDL